MLRRNITILGSALLLTFLLTGPQANADSVHARHGGRTVHVRRVRKNLSYRVNHGRRSRPPTPAQRAALRRGYRDSDRR